MEAFGVMEAEPCPARQQQPQRQQQQQQKDRRNIPCRFGKAGTCLLKEEQVSLEA